MEIKAIDSWKRKHTGGSIGLLELSRLDNSKDHLTLEPLKAEIEARLRSSYQAYTRQDLFQLPVLSAYRQYYKGFDMSYHVQLQLESIVMKGKNLPTISPLVDINFMAEVETFILTAGHDVDLLLEPVSIDLSVEGDEMTQMNGSLRRLRPGDMLMKDAHGVCCSILYGQDNISAITPATSHVLYVSYAPAGVTLEQVKNHQDRILELLNLAKITHKVEQQEVICA